MPIWKIVREDPNDDFAPRYFSATGRDVEVQQGLLTYNPANRHLTYRGVTRSDARRQRKADQAYTEIFKLLIADKKNGGMGLSQNQIEAEATKVPNVTRQAVRAALKDGSESGELAAWSGPRNANMFTIAVDFTMPDATTSPPGGEVDGEVNRLSDQQLRRHLADLAGHFANFAAESPAPPRHSPSLRDGEVRGQKEKNQFHPQKGD